LKDHLAAASGEFFGTILSLFFAFGGTQIASMASGNKPIDTGEVLSIALSFGLSLATNARAFYRISGGIFNQL
jgi:aquaporin related protein